MSLEEKLAADVDYYRKREAADNALEIKAAETTAKVTANSQKIETNNEQIETLFLTSESLADRVTALENGNNPDPDPDPPPMTFQPMSYFMGQVLNRDGMNEFVNEAWPGGFHTFTGQSGNCRQWLADVESTGRKARISIGNNWFESVTVLSATGAAGCQAIKDYPHVLQGIDIELTIAADAQQLDAAYRLIADRIRPHDYLLFAYQNDRQGNPFHGVGNWLPNYSRIWYSPSDPAPEIGQIKSWRYDSGGTYPASIMQGWRPQRTPNNHPDPAGSKRTGNMWLLCRGPDPTGEWQASDGSGSSGTVMTGIIRPWRSIMQYNLMISHMIGCNSICWYTNGSHNAGQNMPTYDRPQYNDLLHVIDKYEKQEVIETWPPSYKARNPDVIAPL